MTNEEAFEKFWGDRYKNTVMHDQAKTAWNAAIAYMQEQSEPVAWATFYENGVIHHVTKYVHPTMNGSHLEYKPLFTTPQIQQPLKRLSDDQIKSALLSVDDKAGVKQMTIDIEKLAEEYYVDDYYNESPKSLTLFAEAYAAKVLEEQSAEIAQLKEKFKSYKEESLNEIVSLNKTCSEYQAYINDLREALEKIGIEVYKDQSDLNTIRKVIEISKQALSKTPAQSLQAFENEVIERCAKVCEELVIGNPGRADLTADQCAKTIRALKGGQNANSD